LSRVDDARLLGVLGEAHRAGFIGGDSIVDHIAHARRFAAEIGPTDAVLDLGSGGGLPGLVLAWDGPELAVTLVDASSKRCDFLQRAVGRLGIGERVRVRWGRAEVLGREVGLRATQGAVVVRSFGPPGRTAECAAPFLRVGGRLIVSEPPLGADRWPAESLARLGLRPVVGPGVAALRVFQQVEPCPDNYPRRRLDPPLF